MEAGTLIHMRAASQDDFAGLRSTPGQRQIDRVQHQAGGAGGADREIVLAWTHFAGFEYQVAAAQRSTAGFRLPDGGGGLHAH